MQALAPADPGLPRRVLVLDDDRFVLDMLCDMLAEVGNFEVFAESNARSALDRLASCKPELLLCDLSLPDMDGIEFLQAAAAAAYQGGVIVLSGVHSQVREAAEELARVLGLRVAGSFGKPIGLEQLRGAVVTALPS